MLTLRKIADRSGAEPPRNKAVGVNDDGSPKLENPALPYDALLEPWPLAGVELQGEAPRDHSFADTFVARASSDGYLSFEGMRMASTEVDGVAYDRDPVVTGDAIVLDLTTGPLRYRVLEHPGRYKRADGRVEVVHEYRCVLEPGKKASKGEDG